MPEDIQNQVNDLYEEEAYTDILSLIEAHAKSSLNQDNIKAVAGAMEYATWINYENDYAGKLEGFYQNFIPLISEQYPNQAAYYWTFLAKYFGQRNETEKHFLYFEKSADNLAVLQDTFDLPWVYYWLGQLTIQKRMDGITANDYADEMIRINNSCQKKNASLARKGLFLKGWAHRFIDDDLAAKYTTQALSKTSEKSRDFPRFLSQLIRIQINKKQFDQALANSQRLPADDPETSALKGQALFGQKNYNGALESIHQAQSLYEENNATEDLEYIKLFHFEYEALAAQGKLDAAIITCQNIYKHSLGLEAEDSLFDFPPVAPDILNPWVYHALQNHGDALKELYSKTGDEKFADGAIALYDRIFFEIEHRRKSMAGWDSKEAFNDFIYDTYHAAISCLAQKVEKNPNKINTEKFLEVYDRSKSTLFHESIERSTVKIKQLSSEAKKTQEALEANISLLEVKLEQSLRNDDEEAATAVINLKQQLFSLRQQWKKFIDQHYGSQIKLGSSKESFSQASLRQKLAVNTGLIGYHVTKEEIISFYLDSTTFNIRQIPLDTLFAQHLKKWYTHLSDWDVILKNVGKSQEIVSSLSKSISTQLLPMSSIRSEIKNLIVIPDAFLFKIPFELLIDPVSEDLFIEQYDISYAHSVSSIMTLEANQSDQYDLTFGGFAPSYKEKCADPVQLQPTSEIGHSVVYRSEYQDLPEARKTVRQTSNLFNGHKFIADRATKKAFLANAKRYEVLHLGMHGDLDTNSNILSNLVFSCTPDRLLHLSEIQSADIQANLVVLSACNTGVGEFITGEGPMSISRSFFYAGAKSTLMSLWPVPDQQSAEIMRHFYDSLSKGLSKSAALRSAKKSFLSRASALESHPAFWSGFIIFGNDDPIKINSTNGLPLFFWLTLLILALLGLYFFIRSRRSIKSD